MSELDALETARILVEEYGDNAKSEVNRRAELALIGGDMNAFALWHAVVVFVSDIRRHKKI